MHYAYELIGGLLIFGSSWVTEEMPEGKKKLLYAILGVVVLVYVVFGIMGDWQSDRLQQADQTAIKGLQAGLDSANGELKTVKDQNKEIKDQNKEIKDQNTSLLDYAQKNLTQTQIQRLLASSVSSSDLRQQVQDLVRQLLPLEADHNSILGQITPGCSVRFQKSLPRIHDCVIKGVREENQRYQKQFVSTYLPRAIVLRDAMRARILNPLPFDPRAFSPDSADPDVVIRDLDALSARLEIH